MALKGLMVLLYRYPQLLGDGGADFILNDLVPDYLVGGHPPAVEIVEQTFLNIDTPETENHLLMIEGSRYLVNQLHHDRTGDPRFDNVANGLSGWLLGFMQPIAMHDFLEFNSRPYARMSLHALLNLHEFARDTTIQTAAQILTTRRSRIASTMASARGCGRRARTRKRGSNSIIGRRRS